MGNRRILEKSVEYKDIYETVIETVDEGIVIQKASGEIISWNRGAEKLFGIPAKEILGKTSLDYDWPTIHEDGSEYPGEEHPSMITLATGKACKEVSLGIVRDTGDVCWVSINTTPVFKTDNEKPDSVVITFRDITELIKAQKELLRREQLERIISRISSGFLGVTNGRIDECIHKGLEEIGTATGTDRAYVFLFRNDNETVDNSHEWCAPGIIPQIENLQGILLDKELPWFSRQIRLSRLFCVPDVSKLPSEASREKEHFEQQEIQSLIVVPIKISTFLIGFLGFDSVRRKRRWSEIEKDILSRTGEIFSRVIEREKTFLALRQSEAKLIDSQYISKIGNFNWNLDSGEGEWSEGMYRLLRYEPKEKLDYERLKQSVHHPADREKIKTWLNDGVSVGREKLVPCEYRLICGNGEVIYVHAEGRIEYKDGKAVRFFGTCQDITGRKRAELLQAAQLRLVDYAVNHTVRDLLQKFLDEAELLTESSIGFYHFVSEDQRTLSLQTWSTHTLEKMCSAGTEKRHYPISEAGVWVDCVRERRPVIHDDYMGLEHRKGLPEGHAPVIRELVVPVFRSEKIVSIVGVGNKLTDYKNHDIKIIQHLVKMTGEIIDRKKAEEALRENEARFRAVFESAQDCIIVWDREYRYLYANQAAIDHVETTRDKVIGKDISSGLGHLPDFMNLWIGRIDRVFETAKSLRFQDETTIQGRYFFTDSVVTPVFSGDGSVFAVCVVYRDLTRIKQLEDSLRQAQKMESLGTLAGGVAHEFNNILGGIMGYTEISLDEVPPNSLVYDNLNEILKLGIRARDVIRQILMFSRKDRYEIRPVDLCSIINESLKVLRATIPSTVVIRAELDEEAGTVMADPTQIHQVLMNLATNSSHAMEEKGGILEIVLSSAVIDAEEVKQHSELQPGRYVKLTVSDTGKGLDPGIIDRIFDPFFTTKGVGKGSGLGLSVVHGIVSNYGGVVKVSSSPDGKTVFAIFLPRVDVPVEPDPVEIETVPGGGERILVVDDEAHMIALMKTILERLGYTVTSLLNSAEVPELVKNDPEKYDLVITDLTMPQMSGDRLALEVAAIRPDLPVVLVTGYSDAVESEKIKQKNIKSFLPKPFKKKDLADVVRQVLDGK